MSEQDIQTIHRHQLDVPSYPLISSRNHLQEVNRGLGRRDHALRDHVLVVGLNHHSAPLEIREKVSIFKDELPEALALLRGQVGVGVILSTCNRTEVYCATQEPHRAILSSTRLLSEYHGLDPEIMRPYLYFHAEGEAARHLFQVASGLDSMLLGESQILGQVRDALAAALGPDSRNFPLLLSRLFHGAIRAGRRVQEEIASNRNSLSVGGYAVRMAERAVVSLGDRNILIIGAGEVGRVVARTLTAMGARDITIANRTHERGQALDRQLGLRAVDLTQLPGAIAQADVVFSATGAPGFVVSERLLSEVVGQRKGNTMFLFDLAVPRDIDPDVELLENVRLFNIDDLPAIARSEVERRKRTASDSILIVEEELSRYSKWLSSLNATPNIKLLHQQAELIRQKELERSFRKMPELSPEQRQNWMH